jgi:hypothetical protein
MFHFPPFAPRTYFVLLYTCLMIIIEILNKCGVTPHYQSRVAPFGNPRFYGRLHLPVAYRSLSRPSSPYRAKASTKCP